MRVGRPLQEPGQALVHQLHKQNGQARLGVRARAQVLDDVGVFQLAQVLNFSLEPRLYNATGGWVAGLKEDGVQYFGRADELIALGLVDGSIGAYSQRVFFRLDKLDVAETLDTELLCHCGAIIERLMYRDK